VELLVADGLRAQARQDPTGVEAIGYMVALERDDCRWYGGGSLAKDLSLPRLRDAWSDVRAGGS